MVDAARTPDYWTRPNRQAARAYSFLLLQKGTGRKCLNTNNVKLPTAFSAALISSTTLWKGRKEGGWRKAEQFYLVADLTHPHFNTRSGK